MEYLHVKNLEKYHPSYKDRTLQWAKIYFKMVQGDPDCELIENEIDWSRLIKFILLELEAQKPIPINERYLKMKGFNLKKRPISLTIKMLHNFIDTVTEDGKLCTVEKKLLYTDKEKEEEKDKEKDKEKEQEKFIQLQNREYVFLTHKEHQKLIDKFGFDTIEQYTTSLNDYIGSKGKKYKSHYSTILVWLRKDGIQEKKQEKEYETPKPEDITPETEKKVKDMLSKIKLKKVEDI